MRTKIVKQRENRDCMVACLAMFLNRPYEHIRPFLLDDNLKAYGVSIDETVAICNLLGTKIEIQSKLLSNLLPNTKKDSDFCASLQSTPAILCIEGSDIVVMAGIVTQATHAVYWDGKHMYDPSPFKHDFHYQYPECVWKTSMFSITKKKNNNLKEVCSMMKKFICVKG